MRFSDAKSAAEVEGTEKSTKFRKMARNIIIALTIIVALVVSTYVGSTHILTRRQQPSKHQSAVSAQASIPLASAPVAEWPKWILPPKGKSAEIPVPPGMHIIVDGNRFDLHTVYEDGHENIVAWNSGKSNSDGPITKVYVTNQANEPNIVSYAFSK